MNIFAWAFGALGSGYFWVGLIAGVLGAWLISQNKGYQRFQAAGDQRERDATFKRYLDDEH